MNVTESESHYKHLEKMDTQEILMKINLEDQKVAHAVSNQLAQIKLFVDLALEKNWMLANVPQHLEWM